MKGGHNLKVDFSKMDLRKRPNFILRNLDGRAIGVLGQILNPTADIRFADVSEIEFEYPSQVDEMKLDEYDLLTGMRIVDVGGYGQFVLHNPEEKDNGIVKIKKCTARSLEVEFMNNSISLEEGTYCFWNPMMPDSTIIGIILSEMPSWSIGTISTDLIGKYRTFSVDNKIIYDFMKSDLEETFECVFDFDTYNRKINVRSREDTIAVKSVYVSTKNLAKEIEIKENTDDLVTVLDVTGADGVDIRSVNPMGVNQIYNLDDYMTEEYFSADMIAKWKNWKLTFESYQVPYYNLVVSQNMQISRYATEYAVLTDLKGELTALESQKAALLQAVAIDSSVQPKLDEVNSLIRSKNTEISNQNSLITSIQNQINSYTTQLKNINNATSFSAFFTDNELLILNRYFRHGSLNDNTFVASTIDSYSTESSVVRDFSTIFNLTNLTTLRDSSYTDGITFYTVRGGSVGESSSSLRLNAEIVNGTIQVNNDKTFVASLYLSKGTINGSSFSGGTLSLTGTLRTSVVTSDNSLQFATSSATAYMTYEVSEYQRMSIAWDLYEYAKEILENKSTSQFSFSVDSVNFFALDDYLNFANEFTLGERVYLHLSKGVLTPIVTGVSIDFDDLSNFELEFASDFLMKNGKASVMDNLKSALSSGKSLDFNQYNYSSFVNSGANTRVKSFMESALDTMKNRVLSGDHEELTVDQAGLRCRKYDESTGQYSPKQLWVAHNALMMTTDGWDTAAIGIGEFVDKNLGSLYGIVAPALVGTILAGNNLVIESEKTDGGIAVFKVDGEGASLHNASFNLYNTNGGRIDMGSVFGFVAGANRNTLFDYNSKGQPIGVQTKRGRSITSISDLDSDDEPNASFWLDMEGNAYFKGTLLARDGFIGGWTLEEDYLHSGSGNNYVALNASTKTNSLYAIWAGATNPANAPFWVKKNGDFKANNATISGNLVSPKLQGSLTADTGADLVGCAIYVPNKTNPKFKVDSNGNVSMTGSITWSSTNTPVQYQFSVNGYSNWHTTMTSSDMYRRDSLDGGATWGTAYQFRGQDGRDGSDANVTFANVKSALQKAASTQTTFITADSAGSPNIYGGNIYGSKFWGKEFNVIADGNSGSFNLYGSYSGTSYPMLKISYFEGTAPYVTFGSPARALATWDFLATYFRGTLDFSSATVTGLSVDAVWG